MCAWLTKKKAPKAHVRVGGPNAGHTVVAPLPDRSGNRTWAFRHIPVAAVLDPTALLVLAAGSEVDLQVLDYEVGMLEQHGYEVRDRLFVDSSATLLEEKHQEAEKKGGTDRHGSTLKGIGAARADRLMRKARLYGDVRDGTDTAALLREVMRMSTGSVLIEGTQGFGLGLHAGYYPFATSGDCCAQDFLAQARIAPGQANARVQVWVVVRTYPIRIAGNSGPLERETSWEQLSLAPEYTTVTKKERRVGMWDGELARRAVEANGGSRVNVCLMFGDYWWPELAGENGRMLRSDMPERVAEIEMELGAPVKYVGTGPATGLEIV